MGIWLFIGFLGILGGLWGEYENRRQAKLRENAGDKK